MLLMVSSLTPCTTSHWQPALRWASASTLSPSRLAPPSPVSLWSLSVVFPPLCPLTGDSAKQRSPTAGRSRFLGSGRRRLCFMEQKTGCDGTFIAKSLSAQHKVLTVQPTRSTSRFHHLPSVANTNPPVHLSEGRPWVQCQRYVKCVLFPHLWVVLWFVCLISYHVLFQCKHSKCHSASWFSLWWHQAYSTSHTYAVPLCLAFAPHRTAFNWKQKVHMVVMVVHFEIVCPLFVQFDYKWSWTGKKSESWNWHDLICYWEDWVLS